MQQSPWIAIVTNRLISISVTLKENQKNRVTLSALPDTGAEIDVIPEEVYKDKFSATNPREGGIANNGDRHTNYQHRKIWSWGQMDEPCNLHNIARFTGQMVISRV